MKNGLKRKQKTDYYILAMSYGLSTGRPPHPTHNWKIHRDLPENMPQSEGIYPLLSPLCMNGVERTREQFVKQNIFNLLRA